MKYKVLVTAEIDPAGVAYLKQSGCDVVNEEGRKLENVAEFVHDCDGILTRTEIVDENVYEQGQDLKVIGKHGVGVDNIDVENATKRGIRVVNAPEANTDSVVEHTFTLILALAKNLIRCDHALRQGDYDSRDKILTIDVKEKVLGLIGLGRIGSRVALKARHGLDMQVVAYDPYVEKSKFPQEIEPVETLDELMEISDFVSLHLPYSQHTEHLIGLTALRKMKSTAYFINAARGPIVEEDALMEVLEDRAIAGAALDVFEIEPPSRENRLFACENVIVTPHIAALTKEARIRMAIHAATGIIEVLHGQVPTWPVN